MSCKKETNCSDNELRRMMLQFSVDERVTLGALKTAYYQQIRLHHSDKGGSVEKTKELTRSYRVLRACLDEGVPLPDPSHFEEESGTPWTSSPRMPRSSFKPQQSAPNPWGDDNDETWTFGQSSRRRANNCGFGNRGGASSFGNGGGARARDNFGASSRKDENIGDEFGEGSSPGFYNAKDFRRAGRFRGFEEKPFRADRFKSNADDEEAFNKPLDLSKRLFANGYKYTNEDLSDYEDPYARAKKLAESDGIRSIRGGLILRNDFNRQYANSEYTEYDLGADVDEIDFYTDKRFDPILDLLQNNGETLENLCRKMKAIVNLEWAMSGEFQTDAKKIREVRMQLVSEEADGVIYKFDMPFGCPNELGLVSAGIHVDVRSPIDENLCASAIVESVTDTAVQLLFLQSARIKLVVNSSKFVDVMVNASAFVYRTMLRSIDYVKDRRLESIVYPQLKFRESYEVFEQRRDREIDQMNFLDRDGFNAFQKSAVHTIVSNANRPYPFILFGPPGTGKTVTLVETIRQLIHKSKNNRILVCTPSRMAADNFAETLIQKRFIESKYVFRMHSLSTSAIGRNHKLDPITYIPKEGRNRFFGIPERLNLQLFRVIICTLSSSTYLISAGGLRGYFTHVIVDEAGQATEPETWIPVGGLVDPKTTSLILAGDPRQLGPVININLLKSFGYGLSMLKRLIYSEAYENSDDRSMVVLKQTYRSHFRILRPCSYLFYNNMLVANEGDDMLYKLCEWSGLPTKGFPIIFHSSIGSDEESASNKSYSNTFEANLVIKYVNKIMAETHIKASDIGIISPYKNQVIKLRNMLSKHSTLTIDSIEGFQGSEREVIIMSMVRTQKIGFLQCDLRLNTSISRAKSLLIVIGNDDLLRVHSSWRKFIYYCCYHGGYLDKFGQLSTNLVPYEQE